MLNPAPLAIAASVHVPNALRRARAEIESGRTRKAEINRELGQIAGAASVGPSMPERAMRAEALNAELEAMEPGYQRARAAEREARRVYAESVRSALAPSGAAAAARAAAAVEALREALGELAAHEAELVRAGMPVESRPPVPVLPLAELTRIAEVWA
jgi:hypothetical protein